jgi:hypothetical protein
MSFDAERAQHMCKTDVTITKGAGMTLQFYKRLAVVVASSVASWASCVPASAEMPNPSFYYRLSTEFRGPNQALDVFNGGAKNNLTHLDERQDVSGQLWNFAPVGDGTYRLKTQFRGSGMCLDIHNGGPRNNQPHFTRCADLTGQFWNIVEEGDWVRLTTVFRGDDMCLDIFNGGPNDGQPHLTRCADVTGQNWKLTRTNERVGR